MRAPHAGESELLRRGLADGFEGHALVPVADLLVVAVAAGSFGGDLGRDVCVVRDGRAVRITHVGEVALALDAVVDLGAAAQVDRGVDDVQVLVALEGVDGGFLDRAHRAGVDVGQSGQAAMENVDGQVIGHQRTGLVSGQGVQVAFLVGLADQFLGLFVGGLGTFGNLQRCCYFFVAHKYL